MTYDKLEKSIISAAALHDIGKCCDSFQNYVRNDFPYKKIFCNATDDGVEPLISKDIITHNILSWAFALTETDLNNQPWALSAILYHHVVYGHLSDISARNIMIDLTDDEKETFFSFLNEINQYLRERFDFSIQLDDSNDGSVTPNSTTLYYDMYINQSRSNVGVQLEGNTLYTVARSVLIYADRLASSYPTFADRFANNDIELINSLLEDDLCSKTIPDDNYLDWAYKMVIQLTILNVLKNKID